MSSNARKGDKPGPGQARDPNFDLLWNKLVEPCPRCGAADGEDCTCFPTDDGPGQGGGES